MNRHCKKEDKKNNKESSKDKKITKNTKTYNNQKIITNDMS